MKYIFETRMAVRDYECDIEGIVNNANYLHYAEHTRHLFLRSLGVSFAKFHEQGIDAVVHSMKLQYKVPLRCDDEFISRLNLKELASYSIALSSLTGGRASFTTKFSSYELVPNDIQQALIKQHEEEQKEED